MNTDQTLSVSKGVFVFKNNFKPCSGNNTKRKKKYEETRSGRDSLFASNLWYRYYATLWDFIEEKIDELNNTIFSSVMSSLVDFIKTSHNHDVKEIPTAALFTGINMPDHMTQFDSLLKQLKNTVSPHVACLQSQDGQNIKYFIENVINQFVNEDSDSDYDDEETSEKHIKKNLLNLSFLQCWYDNKYKTSKAKKPLVLIIPDFESFNIDVLKKCILIISWYIKSLPFVLVFGIATDINTLHKSLSYKVFSRIRVKVFHSQKSVEYLNSILEEVFFPCPFQLGGNVFNLFTELFLFYDLSVNNFIQNIKYAMADHFTYGNIMTLCHLEPATAEEIIDELSEEDFESLRQLPSFRNLVVNESKENQVKLLVNDEYLSLVLYKEICKMQVYIRMLHLFLKCLLVLVEDLPRAPLGKQLRELYAVATSKNITQTSDYKDCMQFLNFQSKDEFSKKLSKIIELISAERDLDNKNLLKLLKKYLNYLDNLNEYEPEEVAIVEEPKQSVELNAKNRWQFREKLLELTKAPNKSLNKYEKLREEIIKTLSDSFKKYLKEPKTNHFHEIFFYNNMSIKNYIVGSHRSAIHNALSDPYFYLRCKCCEIPNSSAIKPTMPDICIAYKLHLEYGKMINLYDWLQSFISIVDADAPMNDEQMIVKPEMQARFTQAIAELEFLGFIKSSKRKADHVQRLTWGG